MTAQNSLLTNYPYKPVTQVPDIQFESFNDAKFAHMVWPSATKETKARLLLVHGFGEYTGIYIRLMDQLAQQGYESFVFDQRGAGLTSPGKQKGKTNEFHTFNDLDHFVDMNISACEKEGIPLFMWGHSMGGGIVLNYACTGKEKENFNGFVASGPLVVTHPKTTPSKPVLWLSPILASRLPNYTIDTKLKVEGITSDQRYREFLLNDRPMSVPLMGSFRQIYDFLERGKALYNNTDSRVNNINRPIFVQHGQDDTINDPKGSEQFMSHVVYKDKQLTLYPKGRHSILSLETDEIFAKAFNDLVAWLDNHLQTQKST